MAVTGNEEHKEDRIDGRAKFVQLFFRSNADEAGVPATTIRRCIRNGEHRLALRLVSDAVEESFGAASLHRDEARAWLRSVDLPLLSARTCFEALNFEYEAVMEKLERRWRESA